jgi:hypothetical protein
MKYFVKYEIKEGEKVTITDGFTDINTEVELNAGQIKKQVKDTFNLPPNKVVVSEELKANRKVFKDDEIVPKRTTGLEYTLMVTGPVKTKEEEVATKPESTPEVTPVPTSEPTGETV